MSEVQSVNNLVYADYAGRKLPLDLHLPRRGPGLLPTVLWVPGGGWRGSSRNAAPTWLADHGFAMAAVEYRGSGEVIAPGNVHDCKAAVRWLRAHAKQYGLDPGRIAAYGASAGGHLAALLGLTSGVQALEGNGGNEAWSSKVQSVCDLCGPSDLTRIAVPEIRQRFQRLYDVTEQYLGAPVEQRLDLARLVSPLQYVSRSSPPMLIVHGEVDDVVPVEESLLLHEALKKAGAGATLHVVKGAGHGWDWKLTNEMVASFFKRTPA